MSRSRRRLRFAALRVLRAVRRHYLSLVTAFVLVAALAVALTDGGFRARSAAETAADASAPAGWEPDPSPGVQETRTLVYYIVSSRAQIDVIRYTLRSDMRYLEEQGLPLPRVAQYFLLFETPEEEAHGARYLNQLAESAPSQGFNLRVVDLTR